MQREQMIQLQKDKERLESDFQRKMLQSDSEFDKQKALLEQQITFLNERNQSLEAKEKETLLELKQSKQEQSNWKNDQKSRYEQQIADLQTQAQDLNDTVFDLESKIQETEQLLHSSQLKFVEQENVHKKELSKMKELQSNLTKANEDLKQKYDKDITNFNQ